MSIRERDQELEDFETGVVARIKEERLARRMSQMDLALEAGISQGYLAMVETHQKIPTITTIYKLSRALHISPASLFAPQDSNHQQAKEHIIQLIRRDL